MQILSNKATLKVYNPGNLVTDKDSGEEVIDRSETNSLIINASRAIQTVPDWVAKDKTFKAHVKAGTVLILQTMAIEEDDSPETKIVKAEAQAAAAGVSVTSKESGWGAKPETTGLPFSGK